MRCPTRRTSYDTLIPFWEVPQKEDGIYETTTQQRTWVDSAGVAIYLVARDVKSYRVSVYYIDEREDTIATPHISNWVMP